MIVDDPVVTDSYEAIAAALRPHGGHNDRIEDLTWQQVVGIASAAVAPLVERGRAAQAAAEHERDRAVADAAEAVRQATDAARVMVDRAHEAVAAKVAEVEGTAEWWLLEAERNGARLAVLEALAVQARARWGHERGPSLLRDALQEAGMLDGD